MKKKLLDIYAQDPAERLKALEQTEPIYDTTAQLGANTLLWNGGAAAIPAMRAVAAINGINKARQGDVSGGLRQAASPWIPMLHNRIIDKILSIAPQLKSDILPYLGMGGVR